MKGTLDVANRAIEWSPPPGAPGRAAAGAPASATTLTYQQGPLLGCPELVCVYWGAFTDADVSGMQAWVAGFAGYLGGAGQPQGQEPVIQQYGTFGASVGAYARQAAAPATATEDDVHTLVTGLQAAGRLPPFSAERLFLVLTKGMGFDGLNTAWCAYHGAWALGQYFAICPYPTDVCADGGALAAWQGVAAHEILEACTDPMPSSGWIESDQEEGGDSCNRDFAPLSFGTTQRYADNLQSACSVWTIRETPQLAAAASGPGRLDAVVRGTDRALWHKAWNGTAWGGWEGLGGRTLGAPAVCSWGPDRLDVFARGDDQALLHRSRDGGGWHPWENLGGHVIGSPVPVPSGPNRLDVVVQGTDGGLWRRRWGGSSWGGWEGLGGVLVGPPAVVPSGADRLDVLARGNDGAVWHRRWDGQRWEGWESLGGVVVCSPAAVSVGPDRLDVFARGTDGAMYHKRWDGHAWGGWDNRGGRLVGAPAVVGRPGGRIDVVARSGSSSLQHQAWDGSSWGGWEDLGGVLVGSPVVTAGSADRLDVLAEGADFGLQHRSWSGSTWGAWEGLGGQIV